MSGEAAVIRHITRTIIVQQKTGLCLIMNDPP